MSHRHSFFLQSMYIPALVLSCRAISSSSLVVLLELFFIPEMGRMGRSVAVQFDVWSPECQEAA
jgi:hypothetical protein